MCKIKNARYTVAIMVNENAEEKNYVWIACLASIRPVIVRQMITATEQHIATRLWLTNIAFPHPPNNAATNVPNIAPIVPASLMWPLVLIARCLGRAPDWTALYHHNDDRDSVLLSCRK